MGTESGGIVSPWKCNRNRKPPNGTINPDTAVPPTLSLRYIAFTASVYAYLLFIRPTHLNTTERCLPCFIPLGIVVVKAGLALFAQKEKKALEGGNSFVSISFCLCEFSGFRRKKYFFWKRVGGKEDLLLILPCFRLFRCEY